MSDTYLFNSVTGLKEKFRDLFTHKKKIRALENYSACSQFHHKDYLRLINRCVEDGFLGPEESTFLTFMLDKYELNFLDWSHKTNWLKGEMNRLAANYKTKLVAQQQTFFNVCDFRSTPSVNIPFELIAKSKAPATRRSA